jgi:outer membrane protein assembly factor BamB
MTGATELTASGVFIGTLEYMAPEQIRGGELDARTDVYALGGVAFAALTGEPPFGRVDGDVAKLYAHLNDPRPRASERTPGLSPAIDPVLQRAMAKDPEERYASAGEFAAALERAVGAAPAPEPTQPAAAPLEEPTAETAVSLAPAKRRRRALGALAGVAVVGAVVGAIALTGGGDGDGDSGGGNGNGGEGGPSGPRVVGEPREAGELPSRVTVSGDRVFVADRDGGAVFSFAAGGNEGQRGELGGEIEGIAEAGGSLWAANAAEGQVLRLNPATLDPDGQPITVGARPGEIIAGEGDVWVANRDGNSLSVIDSGSGAAELVGAGQMTYPRALGFGQGRLWVATRDGGETGSGALVEIDPASGEVVRTLSAPGGPHGVTEHEGTVWVTATETNEVLRFDADSGEPRPPVENMCAEPQGIVFGFGRIWVTCSDGTVQPIAPKTGRKLEPLDLGEANLEGIAVGADRVWVAGGEGGGLFEIDPR